MNPTKRRYFYTGMSQRRAPIPPHRAERQTAEAPQTDGHPHEYDRLLTRCHATKTLYHRCGDCTLNILLVELLAC